MEERWYCIVLREFFPWTTFPDDEYHEWLDDPESAAQEIYVNGGFYEYGELGFQLASSPLEALERFAIKRGYKNAAECFYLYEACDSLFSIVAIECPQPELDPDFELDW